MKVDQQLAVPIVYDGIRFDTGLRLDLLVEDCVLVELKAVEKILPVHRAQVLTYLKLAGLRLGLLINFNVPLIKDGIKRIVLYFFFVKPYLFIVFLEVLESLWLTFFSSSYY